MLYMVALASAPRILFENSQFRRPTATFLIARSVIVNAQMPILQITAQIRLLIQRI